MENSTQNSEQPLLTQRSLESQNGYSQQNNRGKSSLDNKTQQEIQQNGFSRQQTPQLRRNIYYLYKLILGLIKRNQTLNICILLAVLLIFLPNPSSITKQGWRYTKLFFWVIVAVILEPFDQGAVTFLALGLSMLLGEEPRKTFSAFGSEIPWLVGSAMFLSVAIRKTGLSKRLSYILIKWFGTNQMSLAYAFLLAEFILAPGIPSVAARGGTIILPLIIEASQSIRTQSMQNIAGFQDDNNQILKFYLMNLHFGSVVTSGIFMTGNHPNLLVSGFVRNITNWKVSWGYWFIGSSVPGIVSLLLIPLFTNKFLRVRKLDVTGIRTMMKHKLQDMGPMTWQEIATSTVMICTVGFWIAGSALNLDAAAVSIMAVMVLISMGIMTWTDCLGEKQVWNTQIRIATLISLANMLRDYGAVDVFVTNVSSALKSLDLHWTLNVVVLVSLYYYLHYMFASNISHASAFYSGFVLTAISTGAPDKMTALLFAYITDVQGSLTHYGNSLSPIVYALGEVERGEFLLGGFLISIQQLTVWILVGGAWWKVLGLW